MPAAASMRCALIKAESITLKDVVCAFACTLAH
jgi:hypothetical protein